MDVRSTPHTAAFGAVALASVLLACGSEATTSEPDDNATGLPDVTTTEAPDDPVPAPTDRLQACRDLPVATTDVMGDGSLGNVDPIVFGVLQTYAAEHPETFGGLWIEPEAFGTIVLAFTDDPEPHREALLERAPSPDDVEVVTPRPPIDDDRPLGERDDVVFDVVQIEHPEAALMAEQMVAYPLAFEAAVGIGASGLDTKRSRVSLSADDGRITSEELAELTELLIEADIDLTMLCLDGEIVDGPEPPPPFQVGDELDVIMLPAADGTFPPDTPVECDWVRFELGDLADTTPIESVDAGLRSVVDTWLSSGEGEFWPQDGWRLLTNDGERATFVAVDDDGVSFVSAELGANGWIWAGAGGGGRCDVRITLPEGLSEVDWELDPSSAAPAPDATELRLLATERQCTGGREMGDRLLAPDVVETDEAVRIVLASVALTGDQSCPGNPSTVVTITLDAPLGDRTVIDGRTIGPMAELLDG